MDKQYKINIKGEFYMEKFVGCIGMLVMLIVTIIVAPILCFLGGYVSGLILNWTVGGFIVNGLNLMLNTTRFTADKLPIICGTLAVVGSFFKSSLSTNSKD